MIFRSCLGAAACRGRDRVQTEAPVRAGPVTTAVILLRTIWATFVVSVATILDAYRGVYRRSAGDARLRRWSQRLLDLVALRCNVVAPPGFRFEPGRATILMSNHQSLYDIPLIFVALPGSIRMLTKKELFRVPIWGRGMKAGEFISIDRKDRRQALRDLEAARRKMEDGIVLWIAPEGTRSRDGRLGELKKGGFILAIETGASIVPIGIRGASAVLPPGTLRGVRLGCTAEVHIGAPIDASAYSVDTRDELTAEVSRRICELAGITPHVPSAATTHARQAHTPRQPPQ